MLKYYAVTNRVTNLFLDRYINDATRRLISFPIFDTGSYSRSYCFKVALGAYLFSSKICLSHKVYIHTLDIDHARLFRRISSYLSILFNNTNKDIDIAQYFNSIIIDPIATCDNMIYLDTLEHKLNLMLFRIRSSLAHCKISSALFIDDIIKPLSNLYKSNIFNWYNMHPLIDLEVSDILEFLIYEGILLPSVLNSLCRTEVLELSSNDSDYRKNVFSIRHPILARIILPFSAKKRLDNICFNRAHILPSLPAF